MRIGLAFKAFFVAIRGGERASAIEQALRQVSLPAPSGTDAKKSASQVGTEQKPEKKQPSPPPSAGGDPPTRQQPVRSDALTLLAALQREARFLDLVMESLDGYDDAQIGAAARDVLAGSRTVVQRMFAPQPQSSAAEGEPQDVAPGYDPAVTKLIGNVSGEGPYRGTVVHAGWKATQCNLPAWQGSPQAALVIAPTEIEVG